MDWRQHRESSVFVCKPGLRPVTLGQWQRVRGQVQTPTGRMRSLPLLQPHMQHRMVTGRACSDSEFVLTERLSERVT